MFKDIVPLVRCHHERIDGRGYPYGMKETKYRFGEIISVADAFDAMDVGPSVQIQIEYRGSEKTAHT